MLSGPRRCPSRDDPPPGRGRPGCCNPRQAQCGTGDAVHFPARREAPPPSAPTLADRLRPLVEQAAAGTLTRDGQAQLERLLLNHWRQRLELTTDSFADAIRKLRQHNEAGALLRELENWLHRPP